MHQPLQAHMDATFKLVRYLKLAPVQGLLFSAASSLQLTAFCDANWGSNPQDNKSHTSYCLMLGILLFPGNVKSSPLNLVLL